MERLARMLCMCCVFLLACSNGSKKSSEPDPRSGMTSTSSSMNAMRATSPMSQMSTLSPMSQMSPMSGMRVMGAMGSMTAKPMKPAPMQRLVVRPFRIRKAPRLHLRNSLKGNVLNIYFLTNSETLYRNDLNDIASYARSIKRIASFIIEGHADFRGPTILNEDLSKRRASGVVRVLLRNLRKRVPITAVAYGESKPLYKGRKLKSLRFNRRVSVVPNLSVIHRGLQLCSADVYLLDVSGSMSESLKGGKNKIGEIKRYPFPKGTHIYLFNDRVWKSSPRKLARVFPGGGTAMYDAMMYVLKNMQKGKTLTVLTDGLENSSRTRASSIIRRAKSKGIKISVIGIGLHTTRKVKQIVKATGGRIYLASR